MCLESEAAIGGRWKLPLSKFRKAILCFGQNAVKTSGRIHKNHCITKGVVALYKGRWSPEAKPLVAPRRGQNTLKRA